MPLDMIVDSLDSIPEALKTEYVKKDDGKFHLGLNGLEDTSGLKSALVKERADAKAYKAKFAEWEKIGKTPAEIAEMTTAAEAATLEAQKKAGKFDDILAEVRKQGADALAAERTKLVGERDAALSSERVAVVETRVTNALTKGKATAEGLELLTDRLGKRIKYETVDGKRVLSIMQADGETPMVGTAKDGSATFDDLVAEAVKQYPSLFEGSGAGGGGTPTKQGKSDGKTMPRAEWDKLSPFEAAAKSKAGVRPVD